MPDEDGGMEGDMGEEQPMDGGEMPADGGQQPMMESVFTKKRLKEIIVKEIFKR